MESDLISRQTAIDAICGVCQADCIPCEFDTASRCEMIKAIQALPPAQPNLQPTCNQLATDTIDRQSAIDTLDKHLRMTDVPVSYPGIISALTEWLNELPSALPDIEEEDIPMEYFENGGI